jgi:type I restriction enzyme M protein
VRGKPIKLTPEEAIRQLYVMVLRDNLGYPVQRMQLECEVTFGREKKRADRPRSVLQASVQALCRVEGGPT